MKYIPSFLAIQRKPRPSMAAWRASHTKLPKFLRASATSSQLSLQKAILNASAQGDAQGIIQVLVEGQNIMSAVNVATAAHRIAKLRPRKSLKERSMQQLQVPILLAQKEFGSQATANTIWALAVLGCKEDMLWESLCIRASEQIREFSGRHLANVAWSLALMSRNGPLLTDLSHEVLLKAESSELTPQSLANVLWSFACLALWDSADSCRVPLEAVHNYAEAFNGRDLSNTLWALSLYDSHDAVHWHRVLISLAQTATKRAGQLHPNDLTSVAWAFVDATPLQLHWLQRNSKLKVTSSSDVPGVLRYETVD